MRLLGIEEESTQRDLFTFECEECEHIEARVSAPHRSAQAADILRPFPNLRMSSSPKRLYSWLLIATLVCCCYLVKMRSIEKRPPPVTKMARAPPMIEIFFRKLLYWPICCGPAGYSQ
jgi:hypothetical protein